MTNRRKIIFSITELGGSGKSHIASNIVDQLRLQGKECAAYALDFEQNIMLTRLGEKDEDGILLPVQNDPLKGVQTFNILNQKTDSNESDVAETEAKKREEVKRFIKSLELDYEYSVYDFPGQGRSLFENLFGAKELAPTLSDIDAELCIAIPVSESKNLVSVSKIQEMFTFGGNYEYLNNDVKFFTFYNPINLATDLTYKDFLNTSEYKRISELGERHVSICLQNVDSKVLKAIKDRPISYYYDFERNRPKNLEENKVLQEIGRINVGIALRRVLFDPSPNDNSGFYHIVPKYFF